MTRRLLSLAILGVALSFGPAAAGETTTGSAAAIDGGSLEVAGREVRLHGIDAPEWDQFCERGGKQYRRAARALSGSLTA